MLVLSRKLEEEIVIGDDIVITIVCISKDKVQIGIDVPDGVSVQKKEVYEAILRENMRASRFDSKDGKKDDAKDVKK